MIDLALILAFACFGLALLCNLARLLIGPAMGDRLLALDTMVVNSIALLVLYGMRQGTAIYFEAALLFALMGFVSTVALARFLLRGSIIE